MPKVFDLPHIVISDRVSPGDYTSPPRNIGESRAPRIREEQGQAIKAQLQASFRENLDAREQADLPEGSSPVEGAYYEIELEKGAKAEKLTRKNDHVTVGATKINEQTDRVSTVVFIPDSAVPVLEEIFEDYANSPLPESGRAPRADYVSPIETIRRARLFSFWTDDVSALPAQAQDSIWWEVWCVPDQVNEVVGAFEHMDCRIANRDRWLFFPESTVLPVLARRADVELAIILAGGIGELRRGSDSPNFFLEDERQSQHEWTEDLADRTIWPGTNAPRVCLLDTGVNRAHPLIEPALSENDLQTVDPSWPETDNIIGSHGTPMAGLALHGDLFFRLQDQSAYRLTHRLESVRILPADGFDPNNPARYGSITLDAVGRAEVQNPDKARVFCIATTNQERSGERASSWSSCVDRAASGMIIGDEADRPRRLFCLAAGNIRNAMQVDHLGSVEDFPIEDPAQAWNALTVGGYTELTQIDPNDAYFIDHRPVVAAGDVSPFSRNSTAWHPSKSPIKPEVVFEAGNRAVSQTENELIDCPSLELLSTGADVNRLPLVNFAATSAATSQAARLAARLMSDHPDYWPETVRALIVHSAEWTQPMAQRLFGENSLRARKQLARVFGYGVPSYERATASSSSDLALVAQREIQPYRKSSGGSAIFNECHYFSLPLPRQILEQYGDQEFELKVTLSYFVEPNPGKSAAIDPARYQSFGLRFDLKRALESEAQFRVRVNANERLDPRRSAPPAQRETGKWVFGPDSVSAGSLHCDVWRGTGAQLAARNVLCIRPVSGWWKERRTAAICEQQARYSLVVTLSAPSEQIDLHTSISNIVEQLVDIDIRS